MWYLPASAGRRKQDCIDGHTLLKIRQGVKRKFFRKLAYFCPNLMSSVYCLLIGLVPSNDLNLIVI